MPKSIKYSLERVMCFFFTMLSIRVNHLDDPAEGNRLKDHIEEKNSRKPNKYFIEIFFVSKTRERSEKFILFMKYENVGKRNLINQNQKKPQHSKERGDEVELFEWVKLGDELPCWENNAFFHKRFQEFSLWEIVRGLLNSMPGLRANQRTQRIIFLRYGEQIHPLYWLTWGYRRE